jgi:methylenetetrahydrofolate reductase (NADPH)
VQAAGFDPVPHIPVRLLADAHTLEALLAGLVANAGVQEVLLISGDYPQALGPYSTVADVLRTGVLQAQGIRRVSIAGHPEGHPKVELGEIRRAEREKFALASQAGLAPRLVTQFFFDAAPFVAWTSELRAQGVSAPMVAGLAGPAKLATLVRFAMRCGVGPSIRALSARGASILKIMDSHGPDDVVLELAQAKLADQGVVAELHFFCFGGFLRTCEWLHAVAAGRFELNATGGFDVDY